MADPLVCQECGVPSYITSAHLWLDNGDIFNAQLPGERLTFFECENIDPLIHGMEQIIGLPIGHIVTSAFQASIREYLEGLFPDNINELMRSKEVDLKSMDDGIIDIAKLVGYGRYEFVDMRYEGGEDDYYTVNIAEPYSRHMAIAGHAAAMEALLGYDHGLTYSEIGPNIYKATAFPSPHPEELGGRLPPRYYNHEEGGLELDRCTACGGPKALSQYKWHLDRGVILNESTKHRMAISGPNQLEPIFYELEKEIGETLPQVGIEAQRRFTITGFYSIKEIGDEQLFRNQLALKGLGNLKSLKISKKGLSMRLDNATMHIMIVGMMQGIFDAAFDVDSNVDWELSEEGNLTVEVKPR